MQERFVAPKDKDLVKVVVPDKSGVNIRIKPIREIFTNERIPSHRVHYLGPKRRI